MLRFYIRLVIESTKLHEFKDVNSKLHGKNKKFRTSKLQNKYMHLSGQLVERENNLYFSLNFWGDRTWRALVPSTKFGMPNCKKNIEPTYCKGQLTNV